LAAGTLGGEESSLVTDATGQRSPSAMIVEKSSSVFVGPLSTPICRAKGNPKQGCARFTWYHYPPADWT
jgi:hypothetical protein